MLICYVGTATLEHFRQWISNYSLNFTNQIYESLLLSSNQHFIKFRNKDDD